MASYYNALRASGADAGKKFLLTPKKLEEIAKSAEREKADEMSKYYYERAISGYSFVYEIISPTEIKLVGKLYPIRDFGGSTIAEKADYKWTRYNFVSKTYKFTKDKANQVVIKKGGEIYKVLKPASRELMAGFKDAMTRPSQKIKD